MEDEKQDCIISRFAPPDWKLYRDIRLHALRESPDSFGSTFASEQVRSDEHWKTRLADASPANDFPLRADRNDAVVGLAWGKIKSSDSEIAHIYQMWVEPDCRGAGIGKAILAALLAWTKPRSVRTVALGVTCGNLPARSLYESVGFKEAGQPEPLRPGSPLLVQKMHLEVGS